MRWRYACEWVNDPDNSISKTNFCYFHESILNHDHKAVLEIEKPIVDALCLE